MPASGERKKERKKTGLLHNGRIKIVFTETFLTNPQQTKMKSLRVEIYFILFTALLVAWNIGLCEVLQVSISAASKENYSLRIGIDKHFTTTKQHVNHAPIDLKEKESDDNAATKAPKANTTNVHSHTPVQSRAFKNPNDSLNTKSRPLLIFKHNAKAGGGSIKTLLEEIKPIKLNFEDYESKYPNITVDETYVYVGEDTTVKPKHHRRGFVISSMREPCDQYLSLWSFGSKGKGYFRKKSEETRYNWTMAAYGQDAPLFDSRRDIEAFQKIWLKDPQIVGKMRYRFIRNFGHVSSSSGISHVDCWVFLDDFQGTLYSCLKQFEDQGGWLDWDTPLLSELTKDVNRAKRRRLQDYVKDDPVGNPQTSHHAECSKYFDEETAKYIENGRESIIYKIFGYKGCCKHGREKALTFDRFVGSEKEVGAAI